MATRVRELGGSVYLRQPVKRVLTQHGAVTGFELSNGERPPYRKIISTMPLTLLVNQLDDVPAHVQAASSQLTFRNTILVYLNVRATDLFPDNWIYVHSPDLHVGRITNFRNWVSQLYGEEKTTILSLEYWCYDHD